MTCKELYLEIKTLPLGAKTMIFIMAIRFLTDFLNNDIYYKTKYPNHNLDRCKNQFKLIELFSLLDYIQTLRLKSNRKLLERTSIIMNAFEYH